MPAKGNRAVDVRPRSPEPVVALIEAREEGCGRRGQVLHLTPGNAEDFRRELLQQLPQMGLQTGVRIEMAGRRHAKRKCERPSGIVPDTPVLKLADEPVAGHLVRPASRNRPGVDAGGDQGVRNVASDGPNHRNVITIDVKADVVTTTGDRDAMRTALGFDLAFKAQTVNGAAQTFRETASFRSAQLQRREDRVPEKHNASRFVVSRLYDEGVRRNLPTLAFTLSA